MRDGPPREHIVLSHGVWELRTVLCDEFDLEAVDVGEESCVVVGSACVWVILREEERPAVVLGFHDQSVALISRPAMERQVVQSRTESVVHLRRERRGLFSNNVRGTESPTSTMLPGLKFHVAKRPEQPSKACDRSTQAWHPYLNVVQVAASHGRSLAGV